MMLEELKYRVYKQNLALKESGLVVLTWGNVSARDEKTGYIVIKPSGVHYDKMTAEDMVVINIEGQVIEGDNNPSSDTPTHIYLYKKFKDVHGIVHTHSSYATAFAQVGRSIVAYGTTHADAFYGNVPCTRGLTKQEIAVNYEENTGKVICESVEDEEKVPAILVKNHGVFTWGKTPEKAVENAITLEEVCKMAFVTEMVGESPKRVSQDLLDKHYFRKHGENAYYGQKPKE